MMLKFREALKRTGLSALAFFREAHYWQFGRQAACNDDFADYLTNGKIPKYANEYAKHVLSGEHDDTIIGNQD